MVLFVGEFAAYDLILLFKQGGVDAKDEDVTQIFAVDIAPKVLLLFGLPINAFLSYFVIPSDKYDKVRHFSLQFNFLQLNFRFRHV